MFARSIRLAGLAAVLAVTLTASAASDPLFRWTDADGRIHFSDRGPPPGVPGAVERLPRPRYAAPDVPAGHYSVSRQWQRLRAEREAREQRREADRRAARELALREREVAAAERLAAEANRPAAATGVWAVPRRHPRPARRAQHRYHQPAYTGLWKPDHPAYRPVPRRAPGRPPGMRDGG